MRLQIPCSGDHVANVSVGIVELPDDAPDTQKMLATQGFLCEDCGHVYPVLMVLSTTPVAQWNALLRAALLAEGGLSIQPNKPTGKQVDAILAFLGIARKLPK